MRHDPDRDVIGPILIERSIIPGWWALHCNACGWDRLVTRGHPADPATAHLATREHLASDPILAAAIRQRFEASG